MSILEALESAAGRHARRIIGPWHRRRHSHDLRRGLVSREVIQWARSQWWGADRRWYPGGTPPRQHNRVTALVDGDQFFSALIEALDAAEHYVFVIGWCATPHIPLRRQTPADLVESRLAELLNTTSQRVPVRLLLWSGAPALFQPTIRRMEAVQQAFQDILTRGKGDLHCHLDRTAHFSHCHHQKAIVVDGRYAFVGGMDLTTFQGDRWDTHAHTLRAGPNWHDVQVRIEGDVVADVEHNFRQRWAGAGGGELPEEHCAPPTGEWDTPVQIVRTIPRGVYDSVPLGEFGIHYSYIHALRQARRLIYLENQYLWSLDVMDALIAAMYRRDDDGLRIVIVLPARAYTGKWDNDQHVEKLRKVDGGRGIVSVYCPYTSGPSAGTNAFSYRPIYVHAKVGIIDDEWCTVGSANLNTRSLVTDSEINAVIHDQALARSLRVRLWAEHLNLPCEQVEQTDPAELIDRVWTERAAQNADIIRRGERPLVCAVHRYEVGRMPGSWLLEEAEALTLEH